MTKEIKQEPAIIKTKTRKEMVNELHIEEEVIITEKADTKLTKSKLKELFPNEPELVEREYKKEKIKDIASITDQINYLMKFAGMMLKFIDTSKLTKEEQLLLKEMVSKGKEIFKILGK